MYTLLAGPSYLIPFHFQPPLIRLLCSFAKTASFDLLSFPLGVSSSGSVWLQCLQGFQSVWSMHSHFVWLFLIFDLNGTCPVLSHMYSLEIISGHLMWSMLFDDCLKFFCVEFRDSPLFRAV